MTLQEMVTYLKEVKEILQDLKIDTYYYDKMQTINFNIDEMLRGLGVIR